MLTPGLDLFVIALSFKSFKFYKVVLLKLGESSFGGKIASTHQAKQGSAPYFRFTEFLLSFAKLFPALIKHSKMLVKHFL